MSDTGRPGPSGSWDPTARPAWAPRDPAAPAGTPQGRPSPQQGAQPQGRPVVPSGPAGPAHAVQRPVSPPPGAPAPRPAQPPTQPAAPPPARPTAQPSMRPSAPPAAAQPSHARPAAAGAVPRGAVPPGWSGGAPPFPVGAADAGGPDATDAPPAHAAADRRPRWLLPVAVGAGVLVLGGVVAGVLLTRDGAETPAATATTVVLPSPTPTLDAVPREATTAFASALPTSVLEYALSASVPDEEWIGAGALEAWTETYSDGADGTLTVRAAQFETPEEAAAFATTLVAALPAGPAPDATADAGDGAEEPTLPRSGEVEAGGAVVGTYTVVDAGDGTGVAVWQNGTAVLHLTAPADDAADAYAAFPL